MSAPTLAQKVSNVKHMPVLLAATSATKNPADGYLVKDIIKMSFESYQTRLFLLQYLLNQLITSNNVYSKIKILQLFLVLLEEGHIEFKQTLRRNPEAFNEAAKLRPHQPKDQKLVSECGRIRDMANKILDSMYSEVPEMRSRPGPTYDSSSAGLSGESSSSGGKGGDGGGSRITGFGNTGPSKPTNLVTTTTDKLKSLFGTSGKASSAVVYDPSYATMDPVPHNTSANSPFSVHVPASGASSNKYQGGDGAPSGAPHERGQAGGGWSSGGKPPTSQSSFKPAAASNQWSGDSYASEEEEREHLSSTGEDLSSYEQTSMEQEQRLVDDITAPGGVRAAPPRESLNKFILRCKVLDALSVVDCLRPKLQSTESQVVLRTLFVIEALLRSNIPDVLSHLDIVLQDLSDLTSSSNSSIQAKAMYVYVHVSVMSSYHNTEKVSLIPGAGSSSSGYCAIRSEGLSSHSMESIQAVSFHDVEYEVRSCFRRRKKKILNGISGILPQGLNAIMGPTGSGKTSLLDILAGRKDTSGLSGLVLVNGERQPKNFKCLAGYVVQDDVVMGTLSVRENLHFSAALRLPSSTTREQRRERVNKVIEELGLQYCAETKIGTEFIRGVSGGERKRTNIGMELIIEPKVLFLDEPTTGLDANTAVSVVEKLKILSKERECIVIMSIHQPRYSIFKQFDTLTLLSKGSTVYHGSANQSLEYFDRNLGYHCEDHENPADFFLDVIIQCENNSMSVKNGSIHQVHIHVSDDKEIESSGVVRAVDMEEAYLQSDQCHATQVKLTAIVDNLLVREKSAGRTISEPVSYATNIFWQLLLVCSRSFKNLLRNPMTSVLQIVTTTIFALLVGLLYLQLNRKEFNVRTVVNDRIGAMFFIVMNQVFSNLSAVDVFIKQKALFIHENVSGFYRVSAFFIAKVFSDMLPMRFIPLIVYVLITYFMVGFQLDVAKFFIYSLTLGLASVTASSLAFAISARVTVTAVANLLIAMVFVLSMLFGGFLVSLNSLPWWLRWIKYLSLFRYSIEALTINELAGQCYFDSVNFTGRVWSNYPCSEYMNVTNSTICELPTCVNGTEDLLERGYETSWEWLWYDQVGLFGLTTILLSLTYFNLRTIKKLK